MRSLRLHLPQGHTWTLALLVIAMSCQGLGVGGANVAVTPQRFVREGVRNAGWAKLRSTPDGLSLRNNSCATAGAPEAVSCVETENSNIEVAWSAPSLPCAVVKYVITSSTYVIWSALSFTNTTEVIAANGSTYVVQTLVPYSNYSFKIQAAAADGEYGEAALCNVVTKADVPSAPVDFRVTAQTAASLSTAWKAPENENGEILGYFVQWFTDGAEVGNHNTSASELAYSIGGLQPCTAYTVNVAARNAAGLGDKAVTEGITEFKDFIVTCTQDSQDLSLHVKWNKSDCDVANYVLSSVTTVLWSQEEFSNTTTVAGTETEYVIENPVPLSFYSFELKASINEVLVGNSMTCNIVTEQAAPGPPQNLVLLGASSSSLSIQWEQPAQANGVVISYLVSWSVQGSSDGGSAEVAARQHILEYNYYIDDLVSDTEYHVTVQGNTGKLGEAAEGDFSTLAADAQGSYATPASTVDMESYRLSTGAIIGIATAVFFATFLLMAIVMSCMKKNVMPNWVPAPATGTSHVNLNSETLRDLPVAVVNDGKSTTA